MQANSELRAQIDVRPDVCAGKPLVRDARIALEPVWAMLAASDTVKRVLEEYSVLKPEDTPACLLFAHRSIEGNSVHDRVSAIS